MTELVPPTAEAELADVGVPTSPARRPGRFVALVRRTLGGPGAWTGVAVIGTLAVFAVFAPLLANSFPLVARTADGTLHFPAFRFATFADVSLPLCAAFVPVAVWRLRRRGPARRWAVLLGAVGLIVLGSWLFVNPPGVTVFESWRQKAAAGEVDWAVYPPIRFSPQDRLRDVTGFSRPLPPTWSPSFDEPGIVGTGYVHLLGTDRNGADIASKMIHASRIAMAIGFLATGIAMVIGIVLGALMGFFSGVVDLLGMRLVEVFEAIPVLFLLLTFVAFFGRNLYIIMVIIGVTGWTGYARFVRAEFLRLRQQDFVQAAKACGLPLSSVLFRHMLPNGVTPVLVAASFGIASAILSEATLSFLGLGLIDAPSWGQLLNEAVTGGGFYWWLAAFPGFAIFATVLAYNLVGESLRDALDPKASSK